VCAFVFGVIGPPVGSLAISVPMVVEDGAASSGNPVMPLGLALGFAVLSYLFGLVPAVAAGAVMGFAVRLRPWLFLALAGVVGAIAAFAFASAIDFGGTSPGGSHPVPSIAYMAVPGALGGLVAGACMLPLARWLGLRGR
jgi:hypothetical protein